MDMTLKTYNILRYGFTALLSIPIWIFIWNREINEYFFMMITLFALSGGAVAFAFMTIINSVFNIVDPPDHNAINLKENSENDKPFSIPSYYRTFDIKTNYSDFSNRAGDHVWPLPTKVFIMNERKSKQSD